MRISKGSKIEFKISYDIPVNDVFDTIKIVDSLAPGLSYNEDKATVFVDGIENRDENDVEDDSTEEKVVVTLNETIAKGDKIKKIEVVIPVIVTDIDALITAINTGVPDLNNPDVNIPLENIAIITALDINNEILSEEKAKVELEFEKYNIYGLGSGYTVKKTDGETVYLIVNTTGVDTLAGWGPLDYKFIVQINENLDISRTGSRNIFITVDGRTSSIDDFGGRLLINNQEITVNIAHNELLRSKTFYISIAAITKSTITDINENFILSQGNLEFLYFRGQIETVSVSPAFNIRTNLEEQKPELSHVTKLIKSQ